MLGISELVYPEEYSGGHVSLIPAVDTSKEI